MQLNGLTRLLDTWADRPVKLLYLLNARALPLTSKLSGSRQSKIIKQGAPVNSLSTRALPLMSKLSGVRQSKIIKQGASGSLIPQRKISVNLHACLSCFGGSAGLPVHVEGKPLYI